MRYRSICAVVLVLGTAACAAPRSTFVLVPDREGHVGSITVTNPKGTATLSSANEAVTVASADAKPGPVKPMDPARIQQVFGAALAAEPPAPAVFRFHFKSESAEPDAESLKLMEQAVAEVKARNSKDINVNGHTDTTGDAAYNMRLSLGRAHRVRDLLVNRGVDAAYVTVEYHGEGDPVVPTADNVAEPRNRRVEVVVR